MISKQGAYRNLFTCKDKVAVVTGGAGLVGSAIARGLYDFGAKVYIADIDEQAAKKALRGTRIKYVHLDITSEKSVKKMVTQMTRINGRIDILVNSAYPKTKDWGVPLERLSPESWRKNLDMHLGGYFLCCKQIAEAMKKQKKGNIINLASIYGMAAPDFGIYEGTTMTMPAAYSAIKGGIIAFTRYLATYYAGYNIRANVISPGGIYSGQNASFVKNYSKKTPLGRMGSPEDIVGAAVYLASDASSYVTGHNLIVDGGWTIW